MVTIHQRRSSFTSCNYVSRFNSKRNMYHRELYIVVSFQPVKIIPVRLWQSVFCHLLAFISDVTHLGKKDIGLTRFLLQPHCKAAFLPKTFQEQKSIPVACIPPTCADHICFNNHQMSALVGGGSWTEQVWTGLQWWPPDVTSQWGPWGPKLGRGGAV